jgi:membrane protein DedA with SNARE-associated domain
LTGVRVYIGYYCLTTGDTLSDKFVTVLIGGGLVWVALWMWGTAWACTEIWRILVENVEITITLVVIGMIVVTGIVIYNFWL